MQRPKAAAAVQTGRSCPVCGGVETSPSPFSRGGWEVGVCSSCGMTYLSNPPSQEVMKSDHSWVESRVQERKRRRRNRRVYYFFSDAIKRVRSVINRGVRREIALVQRMRPDGGRILDIGCADGGTLRPLKNGDWQLFGVEPSPDLARRAQDFCAATGGRVVADTALAGLPRFQEHYFDLVIMRSFLEHDLEASSTLREVHRVLVPGGCAVIKVPNAACWNARLRGAGWPGVRHPDHVNYFKPEQLLRLLETAGFSRIEFPLKWRLPTSDNMWVIPYK